MKNMIYEIKNTLQGIRSRLEDAEEWIKDLEDKVMENTQAEQQKVKVITKCEDRLRDL